ncbi:MAG: hypothetical protein Kow00106_12280 [Anaerolineae bacterium]
MGKKTTIADLEQERATLSACLADLERARAQLADDLAEAQARAARDGDASAAASLERRRAELATEAERLSAGLAAVEADLHAAREAQAQAERDRLERRLARIYAEAGDLADKLQADPTDRAGWARLFDLHAEHLELRRTLYGVNVLAQPQPCPRGFNWQHPRAAWRTWCAAVERLAFGPERSAEDVAMLQRVGLYAGPPPRSLRAAMGL